MKMFAVFVVAIACYCGMACFMIREHDNDLKEQQTYVNTHGCKLVKVIPERTVGMAIHGETDIYKCPSGKIVTVN